jgi:hypothetical protein
MDSLTKKRLRLGSEEEIGKSHNLTAPQSKPDVPRTSVGVILAELGKLNVTALRYLIVHLNTLQSFFKFELLDIDTETEPLLRILRQGEAVDRDKCRAMLGDFAARVTAQIAEDQQAYGLADRSIPQGFVVITMARFSDRHYGLKEKAVQIQALGDWERSMAPPSILEFIITLLLRQAASFAAPSLSKSVHLGTKGCLFNFTADLGEARYKALQGFVCSACRRQLQGDNAGEMADELVKVLSMDWLGELDDPHCPAGIVKKLGYDLFLTQGIKPTWTEAIRGTLRDEGTKEFVKLIGGLILAGLLIWLGLKKP